MVALFDDLGKRISQAGQTAVQKTKEMTDIARNNSLISEEEKKVDNNYYQIGKLYFAIHKDNYENEFAGMITSIFESESKIKQYRKQIQDIKGVIFCEKCGAEIANNVAFCSSCGASISRAEYVMADNTELTKCGNCGAMVDKNVRFCTSCGKPMESISEEKSNSADISSNKCPNCGKNVAEGIVFCTECGSKIVM